jgi:tetratricopeptide (TPR) repeat protein
MKKLIITVFSLLISISFCMAQLNVEAERYRKQQQAQKEREAQSLREEAEHQRRIQAEAAKQRQEAEAKQRQEFEQRYNNAITSAEKNFEQKQYVQAKQDYKTALDIKPENAASINPKIVKIDEILQQQEEAERERKYQDAIESAQRNFNQRKYVQAEQDYKTALKLKPENATFINSKIAEIDRKMNEPATLHIYRKGGFLATSHRYDIFLDNVLVGNSKNNWITSIPVSSFGQKTVSATIEGRKASVQINFEPGGVYYVQSSVKSDQRNTGETRTTTSTNYKSEGSIFKGTYKVVPDGKKTTTTAVTETYYTPILQLVDKNIGESEYDAIKNKMEKR